MCGLAKWRIASYLEVTLSQNETESHGRREMFDFCEGRKDDEGEKFLRVMDRQVYLSGGLEQTQSAKVPDDHDHQSQSCQWTSGTQGHWKESQV